MALEVILKYNDGRVQVFDNVQKVRVIDGNQILFRHDTTTAGTVPSSPAIVEELEAPGLSLCLTVKHRSFKCLSTHMK